MEFLKLLFVRILIYLKNWVIFVVYMVLLFCLIVMMLKFVWWVIICWSVNLLSLLCCWFNWVKLFLLKMVVVMFYLFGFWVSRRKMLLLLWLVVILCICWKMCFVKLFCLVVCIRKKVKVWLVFWYVSVFNRCILVKYLLVLMVGNLKLDLLVVIWCVLMWLMLCWKKSVKW